MAHNLKKFNSEADYSAATLNYPAVSWVTGTNAVHFDATAPADLSKVMMAFVGEDGDKDVVLWNGGASTPADELFDYLTLNDYNLLPTIGADGTLHDASLPSETYVAKYGLLDDSEITDIFSGELGGGWGSSAGPVEFFVPSSVTEISSLPDNVESLVIDNDTVPTISFNWCTFSNLQNIYVPDNAVSTYQTTLDGYNNQILPISQYTGHLPI